MLSLYGKMRVKQNLYSYTESVDTIDLLTYCSMQGNKAACKRKQVHE